VLDPDMPMRIGLAQSDNDEDEFLGICPPVEVPRASVLTLPPTPVPVNPIDIPVVITAQASNAGNNTTVIGRQGGSSKAPSSRAGCKRSLSLVFVGILSVLCLKGL
jgi:hypothetical protein